MDNKSVLNPTKPMAPPAGLQSIINECLKIYPDQPNPLQVTTVLKFWLGGQDPLDYISMYHNPGNIALNIPPHWHYVTFGLSDLHGDGRVHTSEDVENIEQRSGMGFELTFRLLKKPNKLNPQQNDLPPVWPANLLQMLARYVFQTGNRLCAGDNVPWKRSLDNSMSSIQHLLIASDPQLNRIKTPFGWVDFCQIVGVTEEELDQATWWKGTGVLNLMKKDPQTGGEWLITDMERCQSVFELFPKTLFELKENLETDGSDLAGINAEFSFREIPKVKVKSEFETEISSHALNEQCRQGELNENIEIKTEINEMIKNERTSSDKKFFDDISKSNSLDMSCMTTSDINDQQPMPPRAIPLEGLQLKIAPNFSKYLVLAIRDRIRHGRHFTFKNENLAVTFVSETVTGDGVVVSKAEPYAIFGYWMQILITDDLITQMVESFKCLIDDAEKFDLPKSFEWPEKNLSIVIDNIVQETQTIQ